MVEVAVLRIRRVERVRRLVVVAVPREGEVHVLGDVAAQHGPEIITQVPRVVALAVEDRARCIDRAAQHARSHRIGDTRHDVEVRLQEPDRESVAQVRTQIPVSVEVDLRGVVVRRIGLAGDVHRPGILDQMCGNVVLRGVHPEHPHERPALLDVGVRIVEIHTVRVVGVQVGISARDVLRVRHVVHALQRRDRRAVGIGRDEQSQRVLAVDVQLAHHEVGHVVVRVFDLLGILLHDLSVEGRTLVVDIRHERVALLRKAEARADALRQVAALVGVRQQWVGREACDREVVARDVGALVAFLRVVRHPVLEAHLRVFGNRFGIGDIPAQAVRRRRGQAPQVAQRGVGRRIPRERIAPDTRADGGDLLHVGPRGRIVLAVRIAERSVEGQRTPVLAQLGTVDGARAQVVAVIPGIAVVVGIAVSAAAVLRGAELPSGRLAPRIVDLVAEARADHQVLVLGNLPLQTGVEAVVVTLRIGIAAGHQRIGAHRRLVPLVHRRAVRRVRIVEEVASFDLHLIAFAPRVGVVDAQGVDRGHTRLRAHHVLAYAPAAPASAARDAQDILKGEVLLVDVVEQPDQRHAAVTVEEVHVAAGEVFETVLVLGLGFGIVADSGIELSEQPLAHARTRDDVDGLVPFAVVHTRELRGIGELVVDLDAVDGLRGKRLDGRRHVLAEELLAVDEDLLDLLALGLDHAVDHRDARHLLQKALDIGVIGHLEGPGVVAHRVALLRGAQGLDLLDDGFDLHARLEFHRPQVNPGRRHAEGRVVVLVADERHRKRILAVGERGDRHGALVSGSETLLCGGILHRRDDQHRPDDLFPGIGIHDRTLHAPVLGEGRHGEQGREKCQQDFFHFDGMFLLFSV